MMERLTVKMKPVLFNTDMVRAILEGRKTMTRRVITPPPDVSPIPTFGGNYRVSVKSNLFAKPPYRPGDILYVRETWRETGTIRNPYAYKADEEALTLVGECGDALQLKYKWRPSIHMPHEAARIFLRVKTVRVERLQDIDDKGVTSEGLEIGAPFEELWDRTINPKERHIFGWAANPWVWVIGFERISREAAENEKV